MNNRNIILGFSSLILTCLFIFVCSDAFASDTSEEFRFKSVRAMGMGNAFSAVSDDGNSFYYNPAGLTSISRIKLELQPVRVIISRDFYDQFEDMDELMGDLEAISESEKPLEDPNLKDERIRLTEKIESLFNDDFGLDVGVPARAILPLHIGNYGLAIGLVSHGWAMSKVEVQRRGLDWGDFVMDMLDDEVLYDIMAEASYGAAAALEFPLQPMPVEVSCGLAVRKIYRWRMTDEDDLLGFDDLFNPYGLDGIKGTADDLAARYFDPDDPWESISEGEGYSVDAGVIGSFNDAINVAVVAHNLAGEIKYDDAPDDELPLDFSFAASVKLSELTTPDIPVWDVVFAAEMNEDSDLRLGLEVIWDLPLLELSGRIGSNHGFLTLGAGIDLLFLDFDYAFYADENTDWHAFALSLSF